MYANVHLVFIAYETGVIPHEEVVKIQWVNTYKEHVSTTTGTQAKYKR